MDLTWLALYFKRVLFHDSLQAEKFIEKMELARFLLIFKKFILFSFNQ